MPGLRVAVLVMPSLLIDTFLDYKIWADMNSPILTQGALEMYLKNGMFDIHKKEMAKLYSDRMMCLKDTLTELAIPEIKWLVPTSGYFGCLHVENKLQYNKIADSLKTKNIELFDTSLCFLENYKNHNYFRISISRAS